MPSLDQLAIGQCARIRSVEGGDALGQRLLEMGLLEGEPVEVLGFAPFGDPMEVRLRDYRLSLRKREAARVCVEVHDTAFAFTNHQHDGLDDKIQSQQDLTFRDAFGSTQTLTAAIVGNPNTGKTTLFNALTGLRHRVGNYPGVTVETRKGQMTWKDQSLELVDLPGTYSLAPRSPDEMLAVDLVLGQLAGERRPDVLLSIVDASNLERNLYLTTQLLEVGVPVVVALNMIDLAQGQGLLVDAEKLSRRLGVPVIPIQGNKHKGLEQLREALMRSAGTRSSIASPSFPEPFEKEVTALCHYLGESTPTLLVRRLLLDVDGYTEERLVKRHGEPLWSRLVEARQRLADADCVVPDVEARTRYGWVRERVAGCVQRPTARPVSWTDRIDRVLTHRLWGSLIFAAMMFLVFLAIFTWAKGPMDLIKDSMTALAKWTHDLIGTGPLASLLADGIIKGVGSVLVFLPQILILFAFIAVLEDCGYMARAAYLMDRLMAKSGLSGKSFIPMLSSVACAIPGIMATRTIENRRDRLVTILVAPLMSCSARLPMYGVVIVAFFSVAAGAPAWLAALVTFCMYLLGIIVAPLVALLLKKTLLRGETPPFVMEMPVYKRPALGTVLRRVSDAGWEFLRRAGTIIVAAMIVVWALLYFPNGPEYEKKIAELREAKEKLGEDKKDEADEIEDQINEADGAWKRQSYLGRAGKAIEPIVRPLGWDWKIGMAALASFPAREVVVGTLGIIYNMGETGDTDEERQKLAERMKKETFDDDPKRQVLTVPAGLSLMVFFALCCQCASTLAVIKRETRTWRWPVFTFVYMTLLAYVGAFLVYQIGSWMKG
jgi:ferrous iron transport protein B